MEVTKREFSVETDNPVLKAFIGRNTELLQSLIADGKTAQVDFNRHKLNLSHMRCSGRSSNINTFLFSVSQDAYDSAVEYFGENSKTTPPAVFFPVFVRFIKAYKVR